MDEEVRRRLAYEAQRRQQRGESHRSISRVLGATAIIDRLLHHSCVIVINGPSYRDWVHRQETEKSSKTQ